MQHRPLTVCILCRRDAARSSLKTILQHHFTVLIADTTESLVAVLKTNPIDCVVAYPFLQGICSIWQVHAIKTHFEHIPLVIACECDDRQFVAECVGSFADDCVAFDEIQRLPALVSRAVDRCRFQQLLSGVPEGYPPRIKKALQLVHARVPRIRWPEEISSQLGVSVVTFRKEFRRTCGLPFGQYVMRLRLLYATYLGQNEALSGRVIAQWSCFGDEHQFYRSFKRKLGMSFADYRARYSLNDFERLYKAG